MEARDIKIHIPMGCDDFQEALILLDEAVLLLDQSDNVHADTLHRLIAAIVREFSGDYDCFYYQEECCQEDN